MFPTNDLLMKNYKNINPYREKIKYWNLIHLTILAI